MSVGYFHIFLCMYVQYALCFLKPWHLLIITDKTLAQSLMCMPLLNLKLIPEPMTEIEKLRVKIKLLSENQEKKFSVRNIN